jgi:hypothetical protein
MSCCFILFFCCCQFGFKLVRMSMLKVNHFPWPGTVMFADAYFLR